MREIIIKASFVMKFAKEELELFNTSTKLWCSLVITNPIWLYAFVLRAGAVTTAAGQGLNPVTKTLLATPTTNILRDTIRAHTL